MEPVATRATERLNWPTTRRFGPARKPKAFLGCCIRGRKG